MYLVTTSMQGYLPYHDAEFENLYDALQYTRETIKYYVQDNQWSIDYHQSVYSEHTKEGMIATINEGSEYALDHIIELHKTE